MQRTLSALKNWLVPAGKKDRLLRFGLLQGLQYRVDLKSDMQVYAGIAEVELNYWFRKLADGARTAIDVGGAHGYYSLFFLMKTEIQHLFAFEPDSECLANFRHNIRLNFADDPSRLTLSTKLVGNKEDEEFTKLDSLVDKIQFPCVIKVDIEGGELDALKGATKILESKQARWVFEIHSEQLMKDCTALLESYGYKITRVPRSLIRVIVPELRPAEFNEWIVAEPK